MNIFHLKQLQKIWTHPANKGQQVQAIKRSINWWLSDRNNPAPVEVETFGYKLLLHPDSFQARGIIYYTPLHDYDVMQFVQRYLRPGDNFIDIGANIGQYTLLACSVIGDSGHVSAFEPVPQTIERLQENLNHNNLTQVTVYPMALGETDSLIDFTVVQDAISHITAPSDSLQSNKIQIPCCCLDNALEKRAYAMAKIDVEGGELAVLKGAKGFLSQNNPPLLMLEINGSFKRYGVTKQDIIQHLYQFGYRSAVYKADTNQLIFTPDVWGDVLFISRDHIAQVIERIQTDKLQSADRNM